MSENGEIILYQTEDGDTNIEVTLISDTVWLNQAQMGQLFQTDQSGIARHLKNIFKSGELDEESNMQKMHNTNWSCPSLVEGG